MTSRSGPRRTGRLLGLLLATSLVVVGCARGVAVTPPTPDAATGALCDRVIDALPRTVAGQDRRTTTPEGLTAAWGDPPIVLRCGVPRPAALMPTSQLVTVDGVDWFAEPLSNGYLFTTYGRAAYVEVAVPSAYQPPAAVLTELAAAVGVDRSGS